MKKTKEIVNQERRFFRLCSVEYKEMIRKKRKMTLNDFNRIFYVLVALEMIDYAIYFTMNLFPELLRQSNDRMAEIDRISEGYYSQADNVYAEIDKSHIWLQEFWKQMPLQSQREKYKEYFSVDMDLAENVSILL